MTVLDLAIILILVVYAVLGLTSGVIRRVIGFLTLFLAFGAATYLAPDGGRFMQQSTHSGLDPADARLYAFFGFALIVIVLVEGLAAAYHPLLQFSFVTLDRITGLILGLITGVVVSILLVFLLNGAANPVNANPSPLQTNIRASVNGSTLHTTLLRSGGFVERLFSPVIPTEPEHYFSVNRAT